MKAAHPRRAIRSFGRSVLAALLVSVGVQQHAAALDFNFSVSNTLGHVSGTFTGQIFGLTDNATSSATSVVLLSFPAGLNSLQAAPITTTLWSNQIQNSFTLSNGQITGASFYAHDASNLFYLELNASGIFNYLTLDGAGNYEVYNLDGFAGITFTLANSVVTGPTLQNAAPVGVPTNADFQVAGPVETAGGNNTVNTLSFFPGSALTIHSTLFVTSGPVNLVNGSSIFLDGNLSTSQLNVLIGGMLHGAGSIFGNVVNSGTISPGNSPGHIHISGNYTQTSSGTLRIEIGGRDLAQHDLLSVGGTAQLDGTLQLVRLGNFKWKRGDEITFLTASGGVNGEFAKVVSDFPTDTILEANVVYHSNSVAVEAQQGSFEKFAKERDLTPNQKSVARALDSVAFGNKPPKMVEYLDYRKLEELPHDFDRIAPEELTSIFSTSMAYAKVQSLNLQRRTDDLRSGSNGFSAAGLAMNGDAPGYSGSFGITTGVAGPTGSEGSKTVPTTATADNRWGAFLSGTGQWVNVSGDDHARGYDLESGGFTLGLDYRLSPHAVVGLALGYTGTTADLNDRGRVWTNGGKIGIYGTFYQNAPEPVAPTMSKDSSKDSSQEAPVISAPAHGFYVDVAAFGGYSSFDTRRAGLQGDARGDTDGGELDALFGTGYDFKAGNLTFGPTATFNYTYAGSNAYTERGSLAPLDIHGASGESLRTAFGFKASYDWKIGGLHIKPELKAAWQHEFGDAAYALSANFADGGGRSFAVSGPRVARDTALIGAGFAVQCSEHCAVYFRYDGELGSDYRSNSVTGGIGVAF